MRIIQFIDSMYTGGAETSVCNCALEMKRKGLDVSVLCFSIRRGTSNEERLEQADVPTIFIAEAILKRLHLFRFHDNLLRIPIQILFSVPFFRAIMKCEKPDVLHMHLDALLFYPFIPRMIRKRSCALWTIHSEPDVYLKKGVLAFFRRNILKHNPQIIILTLDSAGQEYLKKYHFRNQSKIVKNGISIQRFTSVSSNRKIVRSALKVCEDAFVIGHVGRFGNAESIKNQKFLVDLFIKLHAIEPRAILLLVGGGRPSSELNDKIDSDSIRNHVIVLSNRSDIPDLMGVMDVFVLPSKYEGFPMTLIEAQAAGLRCVVSDTVTRETALTEKMSFLPLDVGEDVWIDTILHGARTEKPRGSLEKYDIECIVDNLANLYSQQNRCLDRLE